MALNYPQARFTDEQSEEEKQLSIKDIILQHLRKISQISCQEFTGGYWEKKPVKVQGGVFFSEIYHNDVREEYCNAIDNLMIMVYAWSDKIYKDIVETFEKLPEEQEVNKKVKAYRTILKQTYIMFERYNFFEQGGVISE